MFYEFWLNDDHLRESYIRERENERERGSERERERERGGGGGVMGNLN